ncbi:AsmA family protein [Sulfurirhabdus autotrophica]|uniref:AsmA protein n=1 Tax=Sulfurirhabdus autotrophica TaxID=1706046 RepID=A0A4R3XYE2_9PROT|nr:AsmA family protein [Sulfurirhabdus autotrophica]TCV84102.1 AsmA protein [Sulfurirhabdus autotrophica]
MNKTLKYILITVVSLAVIFALLLVTVAFVVNPNDYKPLIVKMVQEKKQRTLTLAGDIKLALFPKLGLNLGKVSLSEHNGTAEFAAVDGVKLYVEWLPLLKKSLVVDHVTVDGARAKLVRFKDGTTNIDDLIKKEEESEQLKFDIDGVKISNSTFSFDDQMEGRKLSVSEFGMRSGRLRDATKTDISLDFNGQMDKPQVKAHVKLDTGLLFELEKKHYAMDGLDLNIKGDAAGFSNLDIGLKGDVDAKPETAEFIAKGLKSTISGMRGSDKIKLKLDAPKIELTKEKVFSDKITLETNIEQVKGAIKAVLTVAAMEGTGKAFKAANIELDVDGKQGENAIKGKLTSPFAGNMDTQRFDLAKLVANLTVSNPKLPKGQMVVALYGDAHADLKKQDVALNMTSKLDDSNIQAKLGMTQFASPAYRFDVAIDQLDVDRYLPKEAKPKTAEPEKPMDLSALKTLNATGSLRVGTLKVSNIKSSNVRLDVKAVGGKLDVKPLSANLYQGSMDGAVSVVAKDTPQFTVKQNLRGVSVGPLLKDLTDKDMLEGRGTVSMDVAASGATVSAMKKSLSGNASMNLVDGAIKGINVAATLRNAKAKLGALKGEQTQAANAAEKTDFSELKASFNIRNGIAHNNDLFMKSPLLRLGGDGDINIGQSSINYLAKATVVGSLEGQGGADSGALRGITVPVRLSGPFDALKYNIDFNALASEAVKAKVEEKKEEIKTKLQDELKGQLKGLFGR